VIERSRQMASEYIAKSLRKNVESEIRKNFTQSQTENFFEHQTKNKWNKNRIFCFFSCLNKIFYLFCLNFLFFLFCLNYLSFLSEFSVFSLLFLAFCGQGVTSNISCESIFRSQEAISKKHRFGYNWPCWSQTGEYSFVHCRVQHSPWYATANGMTFVRSWTHLMFSNLHILSWVRPTLSHNGWRWIGHWFSWQQVPL